MSETWKRSSNPCKGYHQTETIQPTYCRQTESPHERHYLSIIDAIHLSYLGYELNHTPRVSTYSTSSINLHRLVSQDENKYLVGATRMRTNTLLPFMDRNTHHHCMEIEDRKGRLHCTIGYCYCPRDTADGEVSLLGSCSAIPPATELVIIFFIRVSSRDLQQVNWLVCTF